LIAEALAKLLKAVERRHSGQAKRDPESRIFKRFWIPAFARNDEKPQVQAFYEIGKFEMAPKKLCAKAKEFSHCFVGAIRESLLPADAGGEDKWLKSPEGRQRN